MVIALEPNIAENFKLEEFPTHFSNED